MSKVTTEAQPKPFSSQLPRKLVRLLRDVQAFIVEKPKQFNMKIWAEPSSAECGTVGCICGHMALRDTPKREAARVVKQTIIRLAEEDFDPLFESTPLLALVKEWHERNIPDEFRENFFNLFYPDEWSDKFRTKYGNITPRLAAKRIDYFLETGK